MAKGEAGRRCQKKGMPGNGALGLPAVVGFGLVAGFSTCGFHMVIIESHLFSQYVSCGIDAALCALAALASSRIGHKR